MVMTSSNCKVMQLLIGIDGLGIEKRILVHGGLESGVSGDIALAPLHEFLLAPERYLEAL